MKKLMERTPHSLVTEGVLEHEQTLSLFKPFWVFFVTNLGVANWLLGVIIATMGLNFTQAVLVIFAGCFLSSLLPAATAILGPLTRLPQMEMGRFSLGETGKRIPAFLNWAGSIGWGVITNILSSAALVALLTSFGIPVPFWVALAFLAGVQLVMGVYGHHLIQQTAQYTGVILGLLFIVVGVIAMHKTGGAPAVGKAASAKDILSAFVLIMAVGAGSWATYTADYTRYLPRETSSLWVFVAVGSSLFLTLFTMFFFGYMTAPGIADQTPEGVMKALQTLTGRFAPVVLFIVAFSSIPTNAVNDNSAAYSLMSAGFKFRRTFSAAFGTVLGYIICLFASSSFIDFFENLLFLFFHWVAPWSAIILVHWFAVGKNDQKTPAGITAGGVIFIAVSLASIALFSANSLYTGLLSALVGGVDIGPYIGFVTAGLIYYAWLRFRKSSLRSA